MLKMFNRIAFYSRNRSAVPFFALGRKKGAQSSVGDASNEDSTPHWHHELPQGVFLTDGSRPVIRGIDKDFINKRIYGIILLPKDHMAIHNHGKVGYNPSWRQWLDKYPGATKDVVLNRLEELRKETIEIERRGIRPELSYSEWKKAKKVYKDTIKRELLNKSSDRQQ